MNFEKEVCGLELANFFGEPFKLEVDAKLSLERYLSITYVLARCDFDLTYLFMSRLEIDTTRK